jgi:5-formyltetrahydrofolate cyclo-ligase
MDGRKRTIRQEMRRRRRALSAHDRHSAGSAVAELATELAAFRAAPVVLLYAATDHEVPTDALVDAARRAGKRVFLPRLRGHALSFAEYREGESLVRGTLGIPEPVGIALEPSAAATAIAFVPLLAWDAAGSRVGRGGGHYDRAFSGAARPVCVVGLGYAFQQQAQLPRDPWDLRLDWVVTERGVVRCGNGHESSQSRKEGARQDGIPGHRGDRRRSRRCAGLGGGFSPPPTG